MSDPKVQDEQCDGPSRPMSQMVDRDGVSRWAAVKVLTQELRQWVQVEGERRSGLGRCFHLSPFPWNASYDWSSCHSCQERCAPGAVTPLPRLRYRGRCSGHNEPVNRSSRFARKRAQLPADLVPASLSNLLVKTSTGRRKNLFTVGKLRFATLRGKAAV